MISVLNARNLAIILSLLMLLALVLQPMSNLAVGAAQEKTCKEYNVPVALTEGGAESYHISGSLCSRGELTGKTIQVLVHGFTLSRSYWDFPYQPEKYSYVNALTKEGYATFNIDRIGVRKSSHPPSTMITVDSNAYVVHQIIQKLRTGKIGATSFSKVILVGHSLGSLISVVATGKYGGVDGLVLTGLLHSVGALGTISTLSGTILAQLDPVLRDGNYPLGYITLAKYGRKSFYNLNNIDPKILEIDNQTKGTGTTTEVASIENVLFLTFANKINVPVLLAIGEKDKLFCDNLLFKCTDSSTVLNREKHYYSQAPSLEVWVLPNAGHNMNYERNAKDLYQAIGDWSNRHIGS